jgi:hypothetical protein
VGDLPIELLAANSARREGERITIDRGPIVEAYDVAVDQVEQSFVIRSLPGDGDLTLRIRVETDLVASERAEGFAFTNARGGIHYGRAFVRDARGAPIPVPTTLGEDAIEIVVPQHVVAHAALPLVVDPIITFFFVNGYQDQFDSDIAYDVTNDVYLIVEEEKFASPDDDVFVTRVSGAGAIVGTGYADISSADWQRPKVANLNAYDQFLVVASARDGFTAFGQRFIAGRQTPASSLSFGAKFPISPASGYWGDMVNPDVGGDPYPTAPAYYCVAWQWNTVIVPQERDITYQMVDNAGAVVGSTTLLTTASGAYDELPAVSNGNGGSTWAVTWQRASGNQHDVKAAYIAWSGPITTPEFTVVSTPANEFGPSVASPYDSGEFMVAYLRDGAQHPIGVLLSGTSQVQTVDLAPWSPPFPGVTFPSIAVDCDGRDLFLGLAFTPGNGPEPNLEFTHFSRSGTTFTMEYSAYVAPIGLWSRSPAVCTKHSTGGLRRFGACTYDRAGAQTGPRSTHGFLFKKAGSDYYQVCGGPGFGTNSCPCAVWVDHVGCPNSLFPDGAVMVANDGAFVSEDSLVLTAMRVPDGPCLFFQGTSLITNLSTVGTTLGDGILCLSGTISRLGIGFAAANTVSYPGPTDPPVSVAGVVPAAQSRWYQGWYRDAAAYCTSSTFNLTTAIQVNWLP